MVSLLLLGALAHAGPAVPLPPINPCTLVTVAEATALLGVPVTAGKPTPEEKDDDTSGMVSYCMLQSAGQKAVMVVIVRFASAATALKEVNKGMIESSVSNPDDDNDPTKVDPENGIGDRAFFASNKVAASLLVIRGEYALAVGLMNKGTPAPVTLRPALRKTLQAALARLP